MPNSIELAALRRLQAIADAATPRLRRQVQQALDRIAANASVAQIERALRTSDAFALHDLAARLPIELQASVALLEGLFRKGAEVGKLLLPGAARIGIRFDSTNRFAQAAAKKSAAEFVTGVTQQTRDAIRQLVVRGFADGIPPRELAQLIKPIIGLTEKQATAVARLKAQLIADGVSRAEAQRQIVAAAERLRKVRSITIARTEVIRASAQGQMAAWQEAVGSGLLSARSQKVWITTPDDRLCRYCRPMNGQTATLGTPFRSLLLGRIDAPPLHPQCRCAIGVIPAKQPVRRAA